MRSERYQYEGGLGGRERAVVVSAAEVAQLARLSSTAIPARYFVATAQHESNFATNEVDTEDSGYVSKGLYQLADSEAKDVGMPGADLLNPAMSTLVFAKLQECRLSALEVTGCPRPDVWAYLAVAHNEGLLAALKTIKKYGAKWGDPSIPAALDDPSTYRRRNAGRGRIVAYGDDCITGGTTWARAGLQ